MSAVCLRGFALSSAAIGFETCVRLPPNENENSQFTLHRLRVGLAALRFAELLSPQLRQFAFAKHLEKVPGRVLVPNAIQSRSSCNAYQRNIETTFAMVGSPKV